MNLENKDILRDVTLEGTGYRLVTWDPDRLHPTGPNHDAVGYAFFAPHENEPIFTGEDFGNPCGGCDAIDSDAVLRSILGFLTLGEGDTDSEHFEKYTERQLAFRDGPDREELSLWGMEPQKDDEQPPMPFVDTDSCTYPRAC